jgi:GntR family transcriptional regulator, transcriptional repressor for pyruvate dehydrogenase complex
MLQFQLPVEAPRPPIHLQPMQVPKASDVLADDLRDRILCGGLQAGTALPPERELVAQTQTSRTTVREALRILEVQRLVVIKSGRSGGAFVRQLCGESVASSVIMLIRGQQLRMTALLETRAAIEPACAGLAAKYRTTEDLASLDRAKQAMSCGSGVLAAFLEANIDWRRGREPQRTPNRVHECFVFGDL